LLFLRPPNVAVWAKHFCLRSWTMDTAPSYLSVFKRQSFDTKTYTLWPWETADGTPVPPLAVHPRQQRSSQLRMPESPVPTMTLPTKLPSVPSLHSYLIFPRSSRATQHQLRSNSLRLPMLFFVTNLNCSAGDSRLTPWSPIVLSPAPRPLRPTLLAPIYAQTMTPLTPIRHPSLRYHP
jgi:hypothetical protein